MTATQYESLLRFSGTTALPALWTSLLFFLYLHTGKEAGGSCSRAPRLGPAMFARLWAPCRSRA